MNLHTNLGTYLPIKNDKTSCVFFINKKGLLKKIKRIISNAFSYNLYPPLFFMFDEISSELVNLGRDAITRVQHYIGLLL